MHFTYSNNITAGMEGPMRNKWMLVLSTMMFNKCFLKLLGTIRSIYKVCISTTETNYNKRLLTKSLVENVFVKYISSSIFKVIHLCSESNVLVYFYTGIYWYTGRSGIILVYLMIRYNTDVIDLR